ncbi:hypothetical protein [Acetobacter sp. DsW_063]|uniref:hypothetical protein n=1 Tax=Acetobacter sp. DsW_063 TaxID=1514894 RepID=UPI000A3BCBC0|nr:hypothetical protein [Acetobacter sp. DsW_063]OUJ16508.1 hypothetical protein HK28_12610 [Acetobacter sp. DsW_063]
MLSEPEYERLGREQGRHEDNVTALEAVRELIDGSISTTTKGRDNSLEAKLKVLEDRGITLPSADAFWSAMDRLCDDLSDAISEHNDIYEDLQGIRARENARLNRYEAA